MRRKQKSMIQPLFLPVTPPLPHGLQRGGVFEHPGSPLTFADLAPQTVPTNSPVAHEVPQNVLRAPVTSVPTTDVRPISGFGQSLISADMQPLPIRPRMPVPVPQGATEGGIFGRGMVYAYPATPGVPKVKTTRFRRGVRGFGAVMLKSCSRMGERGDQCGVQACQVYGEWPDGGITPYQYDKYCGSQARSARRISAGPGAAVKGFGRGPDGIGGCGCNGMGGCGCR
jgi:hypothetical protein